MFCNRKSNAVIRLSFEAESEDLDLKCCLEGKHAKSRSKEEFVVFPSKTVSVLNLIASPNAAHGVFKEFQFMIRSHATNETLINKFPRLRKLERTSVRILSRQNLPKQYLIE